MRRSRDNGRRLAMPVLMGCLAAAGCGKRIRGIETDDQMLLNGRRSVLRQTPDLEVVVTPVRVPWGSRAGPVGFAIELTNLSDGPIELSIDGIELHDDFDRIFKPIAPEKLLQSFGVAAGKSAPVRLAAYRPPVVHRRYYRRHHHVYRYRRPWPYPYGWYYGSGFSWGGGPYYDAGYDAHLERQRTRRFLSELLTDQTVEPQHAVGGFVVFPYRLAEDQELTLVLRVEHPSQSPSTDSADRRAETDTDSDVLSDPTAPPEPGTTTASAQVATTVLTFRFEVD
ncbi:MAG: hypothetical protein GY778_10840 [bacterium]|nr:hypothetical protein [bacterium]